MRAVYCAKHADIPLPPNDGGCPICHAEVIASKPPKGYMARQGWAKALMAAGYRQSHCLVCGFWHFPQEQHSCDERAKLGVKHG